MADLVRLDLLFEKLVSTAEMHPEYWHLLPSWVSLHPIGSLLPHLHVHAGQGKSARTFELKPPNWLV